MPERPRRPRPVPPDPEGRNQERSSWALTAIIAFEERAGVDREDAVADLLTDLKHYCDYHDISFHQELRRAEGMYRADTRQPERIENENNEPIRTPGPVSNSGDDEVPF